MKIEQQIEDYEKKFLALIEKQTEKQVTSYFQYFLGKHLLEIQYKKECKLLDPIEEDTCNKIKEIAPYHYRMMRKEWGCLFWVSNECLRFHQIDSYYEEKLSPSFCAYFTYSDFESMGFDREFVKRVRKKYADLGILKISKGMGFTYSIKNSNEILDRISFSREFYCIRPDIERHPEMDWIFDEFSDEYLEKYFKKLVFEWKEKNL